MSFKSREKKRRRRAAIGNVRAKHGDTMKGRHYLTLVTRDCCCNDCGTALRRKVKAKAVFRYEPREILCVDCAGARGIPYRLSRSMEQELKRRSKKAHGHAAPPASISSNDPMSR